MRRTKYKCGIYGCAGTLYPVKLPNVHKFRVERVVRPFARVIIVCDIVAIDPSANVEVSICIYCSTGYVHVCAGPSVLENGDTHFMVHLYSFACFIFSACHPEYQQNTYTNLAEQRCPGSRSSP